MNARVAIEECAIPQCDPAESACSRPAMVRSVNVLPEPEGPTSAAIPPSMLKFTSSAKAGSRRRMATCNAAFGGVLSLRVLASREVSDAVGLIAAAPADCRPPAVRRA